MKTTSHAWHQFLQILFITCYITASLTLLRIFSHDLTFWVVGAGSLASSCVLVFLNPSSNSASTYNTVFSYTIALLTALIVREAKYFITHHTHLLQMMNPHIFIMILIFIAIFITLYLFAILHISHPPAIGLTLVLTAGDRSYIIFILLMILISALALIKRLVEPMLHNIVE